MQNRKIELPLRPYHGFLLSFEDDKDQYYRYSLVGKLKGLAELRGLELGLINELNLTNF
ncbi:hypothetical protein [Polaribacter reichenbachii]|uniref:hypothetical protein n=1 Tax=Polaribacter reichenbachii TaxID=996801 RepID=UPI000AB2F591|nr:hypothetical protein [Polaribacter reichenbachii]